MTKTEIINAAFRVWGRNFYRKTSLSRLAAELKVSKPALYRHFSNKHALSAAMTERFFDDFAASIRSDLNAAPAADDADYGISSIIRSISGFFAGNVYALFFSLINIYDRNIDGKAIAESLKSRGVDMGIIHALLGRKYSDNTLLVRLIFATLTFLMSSFHSTKKSMENPPSDEDILNITSLICRTIECGIGSGDISIDFDKLEKLVEAMPLGAEPELKTEQNEGRLGQFFKAVAEAVAEAGPWDVSMEMVARKLGLSKSSLYVHFKNRKDMLSRLFITEFGRIIAFAKQGMSLSSQAAEKLYLGIYTISVYLRARPEILVAIDWIRTRRLDLGKPFKRRENFLLFEDIDINLPDGEKQHTSSWILFLLVNVLIQSAPHNADFDKRMTWLCDGLCVPADNNISDNAHNDYIRLLFKFIMRGLGGFKK